MYTLLAETGTWAILKDVMVVVGGICTLLITIIGLVLAWKRFGRERVQEEVTAAEELADLKGRVAALETDGHVEALRTRLDAVKTEVATLEQRCERHKALLHERSVAELQQSVRRINGRCDDLKDRLDAARERTEDRFVPTAQHDKEVASLVQAYESLQQSVNNLSQLVRDLLRNRPT